MAIETYSPLRYPGGKGKLINYVIQLINEKKLNNSTYIEPFCGGASVALSLLIDGYVDNIIINDYDRSIYAFWYCVLNYNNQLCELIKNTPVSIQEWEKQKTIQKNKDREELLTLGFSTLFLNRTNRSGIIKAGVIGGKEQKGKYKLDCRFNKEILIKKINLIGENSDRMKLYNLEAKQLIDNVINKLEHKSFIFFDPPYYNKGSTLYTNFYTHNDHLLLCDKIKKIKYHSWILTYDNVSEIKTMYKKFKNECYKLNYSVQKKHKGEEVIFYSMTLKDIINSQRQTIYNFCDK